MRVSRAPSVSDADFIQPRKVALGGVAQQKATRDLKQLWIFAAILAAALLLLALITLAPERRETAAPQSIRPADTETPRGQPAAPTPLELERQKRALEDANAVVRRLTELEIELEDTWNATIWGEATLGAARAAAAEAEAAFANAEYDHAITGYQQAVTTLEAMVERAKSDYAQAIQAANEALSQLDAAAAETALANAARYQPGSAMVEASRRRLERLPEVTVLLDQASQAESKGETGEAIRLLEAARAIDADTQSLAKRLAQLRQARFDARVSRAVADGYEALDRGDFASAEAAFASVLGMKPNDPGARQGLEQTRLARTNRAIETALGEARALAQDEQWASSVEAFERALVADPNLNEALAGVLQARARQSLGATLDGIIADPGAFASDQQFARAQAVLRTARDTRPKGAKLDEQIQVLAAQVQRASMPVQLTLVSDDETDVRLQYHGDLGRFSTKRIETRPGRYLVRGGRDGFREVRFEIDLAPGAQRLEIICTEPIN